MSISAEAILDILTYNHIQDFDTVWAILEIPTYNHIEDFDTVWAILEIPTCKQILGPESNHR
jgi:hypothetical protein